MSIVRKHDRADEAVGSSFQSFLEEAGIVEEVHAIAMARVTAWQEQQRTRTLKASKEPVK